MQPGREQRACCAERFCLSTGGASSTDRYASCMAKLEAEKVAEEKHRADCAALSLPYIGMPEDQVHKTRWGLGTLTGLPLTTARGTYSQYRFKNGLATMSFSNGVLVATTGGTLLCGI